MTRICSTHFHDSHYHELFPNSHNLENFIWTWWACIPNCFVYYILTLVGLGLFVTPTSSNRALTFHHFVITLGPIKYKFTFYTKQKTWTHKHTPRLSFHFRKQKSNLFSTHSLPKVNDEINCHEHRLYAWAFSTYKMVCSPSFTHLYML